MAQTSTTTNASGYWGNCLLVAFVNILKKPTDGVLKIKVPPGLHMPHFYWYVPSKKKHYHFAALDKNLSPWQMIWFKGRVRRYFWDITDVAVMTKTDH